MLRREVKVKNRDSAEYRLMAIGTCAVLVFCAMFGAALCEHSRRLAAEHQLEEVRHQRDAVDVRQIVTDPGDVRFNTLTGVTASIIAAPQLFP